MSQSVPEENRAATLPTEIQDLVGFFEVLIDIDREAKLKDKIHDIQD